MPEHPRDAARGSPAAGVPRPTALLLAPRRTAVSGMSTHLNLLMTSDLAEAFALIHFEVGSEGRNETALGRIVRLIASPCQLALAVLRHRATIVHLNTALTAGAYWRDLAYLIVARLSGARVLYQLHGGALPQTFCGRHYLLTEFVRATLRIPAVIITQSASEREAFRRFLGPTPPVFAFPNGVDCAPYANLTRDRSTAETPLRLLYMGRLVREKGVYELLEGLEIARRHGVAAELVIAGTGPEYAGLRQLAAARRMEQVAFVGAVHGTAKNALLQRADVFLLPSGHVEGLPYALLECMAAGVPAITTAVGAIPELITDGINGLLIEPRSPQAIAAAVGRLASDRHALARMSEGSRATIAARYSIGRLAAELCRVYADLCGPATSRAARA